MNVFCVCSPVMFLQFEHDRAEPFPRKPGKLGISLDPEVAPPELDRRHARGSRTGKRINDQVTGIGRAANDG